MLWIFSSIHHDYKCSQMRIDFLCCVKLNLIIDVLRFNLFVVSCFRVGLKRIVAMFIASALETMLVQIPIATLCTRYMHLVRTRTVQTAQHGTVLLAHTTLMTNTTPNGRFQSNHPCSNDMYARRPNYTIFVRPHLKRIITSPCHAIKDINLGTLHGNANV